MLFIDNIHFHMEDTNGTWIFLRRDFSGGEKYAALTVVYRQQMCKELFHGK